MGSYAALKIAGKTIWTTKNSIDNAVMTLFVERDKVARLKGDIVALDQVFSDALDHPDDVFLGYESLVHIARDRLDVMGFTVQRLRFLFDEGLAAWRRDNEGQFEDGELRSEFDLLSRLTFDEWFDAFGSYLGTGESEHENWRASHRLGRLIDGEPFESLLLADGWLYGFPTGDCRVVIRAALHAFEDTDQVVQDLTDCLLAGWSSLGGNIAEEAREALAADYPLSQKTIVLTEGSSDAWILSGALKVLYPHLVEYYSFMDFEGSRSPGGAGHLVQIVKAFSAAGVANRIVALFDNDTAAADALQGLKGVRLPPNVKVLRLPPLDLAQSYPSIGPTGPQLIDVNGCAASIEMYLGEDVLRDEAGRLSPIQWRGFIERLGKYQGEIIGKSEVLDRFRAKLANAPDSASANQLPEWGGLRSVLRSVFTAFG